MRNDHVSDFVWTEQLSVGNEILDSDHKKLVDFANNLDHASKARDYSAVLEALNQFNACLKQHFLNEELIAHALGIPFDAHHENHQNMLTEIKLSRHEVEKRSEAAIHVMEHYTQFLKDWLTKHIGEKDMLMKPVLQTRPYSFKIEGVSAYGV